MREVKFRAWHPGKEVMVEVLEICFKEKRVRLPIEQDTGDYYWWYETDWNLDEIVLMQYTGFKDSNGVEVYEGDYVKRTHLFDGAFDKVHTGEIVYDEEYARYIISKPNKFIDPKTENLGNMLSDNSAYEVIGNIYENKDLVEV